MKENFHIFIDYLDFLVSCVFSESINSDKVGDDRTTLNLFYSGSEQMMHFHAGGIIVFQKSSVYGNYNKINYYTVLHVTLLILTLIKIWRFSDLVLDWFIFKLTDSNKLKFSFLFWSSITTSTLHLSLFNEKKRLSAKRFPKLYLNLLTSNVLNR